MKFIVYTRHDGGVTVNQPMANAFRELSVGAWRHMPNGFADEQTARKIRDGIHPDHAARYCRSIVLGGVPEWEAYEIIKDLDCARKGTLHELQSRDEIPDGWFRNAWRRSHNGGPISIDLKKARLVQLEKIKDAVAARNRRRIELGRSLVVPQWWTLGKAIRHARDEHELRKIWPEELAA